MRYALFLHWPEMNESDLGAEAWEAGKQAFHSYAQELAQAGVLVSAEVLQSTASSTTLSMAGGNLRVQDGPYADTKEKVGGIFVVDVPNLDAALAWAEKCPSAHWGTVEIRPTAARVENGAWVPTT